MDSVDMSEYRVTVGEGNCVVTLLSSDVRK